MRIGGDPQRRQIGVHVQEGKVVRGVVVHRGRPQGRAAGRGHAGVVLAGDHVGVGDDESGPGHPARALDAQPAGSAKHAHDRVFSPRHVGVGRDRRVRLRHRRGRPDDRRRRIDAVERVQDRARGRQHFVEAAQDQRALHVGTQAGGPRRVQDNRPEDPDQPQRDRGDQGRAAGAVGEVQHPPAPDQPRAQPQGEALQGDRDEGSGDKGAKRGAERRVGRRRPLVEHQRRDPAARKRPQRKADQGERADDQPLAVAPEAQRQGEGDDCPVRTVMIR